MYKKRFLIVFLLVISILLSFRIVYAVEEGGNTSAISVQYQAHVQEISWQETKKDGETAGLEGQNLRIEALKVEATNLPEGVQLKYQAHVQNIGWQSWKNEGETAGTEGMRLGIEALKIELENSDQYSIQYRVYIPNTGWQDWCEDGELAGTVGENKRIEALQIKIVEKTSKGKINIDTDLANTTFDSDGVEINGWKMANVANTHIETYLNGEKIESKITYSEDSKIVSKIKGYGIETNNKEPRFNIKIDTENLETNTYELELRLVDSQGNIITTKASTLKVDKDTLKIKYQSHVEEIGWQEEKRDGETSGTEGQALQIEALKINGINFPEGVSIKYQAHVQNIGWQDWCEDGKTAGTEGKNLRVEAVRIKLENTEKYSIQYRVHVRNIGWQDWCEDGELAGTEGQALRIEAIEIRIVEKQTKGKINIDTDLSNTIIDSDGLEINGWKMANVPNTHIETYLNGEKIESNIMYNADSKVVSEIKGYGVETNNTEPRFNIKIDTKNLETNTYKLELRLVDSKGNIITAQSNDINVDTDTLIVKYQSHVQNIGWQSWKKDGETAGTQGQALAIEAMKVRVANLPEDIELKYQVHVEELGWQDWSEENEVAGTQGKGLDIEAIRIKLENTEKYSIQYRVHIRNIGWQDWCEDGELAGTEGQALRIEAIEIRIVEKQIKGRIYIDTDLANTVFDEDGIEIEGWKMANIPDTKVETYINGEKIESEITYRADSEVVSKIKGYGVETNNTEPRFNIKIDTKNSETNTYELELRVVDNQGNVITTQTNNIEVDKETIYVKYQAHVEDIGWQQVKKNGETSGTEGEAKQLEAIKINIANLPEGVTIKYQAHVEEIGWQDWCGENEIAGTEGKNLRIEAIRIKLENTEEYSIQYRAHVQSIGWQDWCTDGEYAGTVGAKKRIEAIEIRIVEKSNEEKTTIYIDTQGSVYNVNGSIKGWVMSNVPNARVNVYYDALEYKNVNRVARQDVLNSIKGYGGDITNPNPGFSIGFDFSTQVLGAHTIRVEVWSSDNRKLAETSTVINIIPRIEYGTGTYGSSGAAIHGVAGGSALRYYKYGSGPNVFFATFCVHGFEDSWARDGDILTCIADNFYNRLVASQDVGIADKWTIYIFPEVNPDGKRMGTSNYGPGRLTLYSQVGRGLDINRCWQTGSSYTRYTDSRNYNGTAGFQAYEAAALRDFMLSHRSTSGQTVVVDLHGWENQLIGNEQIANYYKAYYPSCSTRNYGSYGNQYIISWARHNLGAKATLVELPYASNPAQVNSMGLSDKYINATLQMLREV